MLPLEWALGHRPFCASAAKSPPSLWSRRTKGLFRAGHLQVQDGTPSLHPPCLFSWYSSSLEGVSAEINQTQAGAEGGESPASPDSPAAGLLPPVGSV